MLRQFLSEHQKTFAALSGDCNPIHVDAEAARRLLFGAPVVHGVHLVLWALDMAANSLDRGHRLTELRAVFSRPIIEDEQAQLKLEVDGQTVKATIQGSHGDAAVIRFSWEPSEQLQYVLKTGSPEQDCRNLTFEKATECQGNIQLYLDRELLEKAAPNVALRLQAPQIALILATTRLVGMECPGQHSIFNSLRLNFTHTSLAASALEYKVSKALERYARLSLALSSDGMAGELQTSFRPQPQQQASLAEIRKIVKPDEFFSQRALVVGGSRGLGEVVAKIISAGGGNVCISYATGHADAEAVALELGDGTRTVQLDVTNLTNGAIGKINDEFDASHVYYFASPRIMLDQSSSFDEVRFAEYARYYVAGFNDLANALAATNETNLRVFYPSTVFIDAPVPGSTEYLAAKAAGEAICKASAENPNIEHLIVRLPKLATDQTSSLLGVQGSDPILPMLEIVRAMNKPLVSRL
jgi:hypothetical protein